MKYSFIAALAFVTALAAAQAPWPLERQDRWGTGLAPVGPDPSVYTTPWISHRLAFGWPVSHGASLGAGGIGYFGDWVDNKVFKFDYNTGTILGAFQSLEFVTSTPVIGQNSLIYACTDAPNGQLYAIDSSIMDFQWFMNTGNVQGSVNVGPEGDVTFGTVSGNLFRLNGATGAAVWSRSGFGSSRGTVAFTRDDTRIIFAHGSSISAVNWVDGVTVWTVNLGSTTGKPGVAQNGTIVVGSNSGTIYGLDPGNGVILWTYSALSKALGAPAFSPDGTIAYVPSYDFRVYALRVADGTRAWSFTTGSWCEHAPSVGADGRIYVHTKNGDLFSISPSGSQVWMVHLNGEARGPHSIGPDGTLYVGYTGPNGLSGMAMVRQQAISLQADGFTMEKGQVTSGGLAQVAVSDDSYMALKQGVIFNAMEDPIRIIYTTHVDYKPESRIKLTVEARGNVLGLSRRIDLWNFPMNRWDQITAVNETVTDSTTTLDVANAQPYSDNAGTIKMRVRWKEAVAVPFTNWATSVDLVHFDVVPQFLP